ncbi:hypothetical protein [Brevibacillus reuszeri]|uniref:hypothetical protein n=1 Tax=Brevibacillus reuszeri TaxID=54915 RepID=UPI00289B80CF|nr:hypothetical protein [Brevibacillus reuszeri]
MMAVKPIMMKGDGSMSECKLDHSVEDVHKKLTEQAPFLPSARVEQLQALFQTELSQELLNQWFHLLKKYDLASTEERLKREKQMDLLLG